MAGTHPKTHGRQGTSGLPDGTSPPTTMELAGVPVPDNLDGKSLVPFLKNRSPETWRNSIVFLRNKDIYYGLGKNSPEFIREKESIGWVSRPDHESKGAYSRDKEIRTYYDGQYGYIYNNCYSEDGVENEYDNEMIGADSFLQPSVK